jgi:CxxC motif-containing protein (DUF1111 family)
LTTRGTITDARRRTRVAFAAGGMAAIVAWCALAPRGDAPADLARLGGPATVEIATPDSFGLSAPGITSEERRAFSVGNSFFRDNWVAAPASTEGRDGLGPLFNANSCSACHADDGRGRPPLARGEVGLGLVVFVSPRDADGAPHPLYGKQLQDQGISGVAPEVEIVLRAVPVPGAYPDGTKFELVRWETSFERPAYGPLGDVRTSLRIGPQVIGGGLLEAVPDAAIAARADPEDRDGDGISGRTHMVPGADGTRRVGKFGWKASQPTLDGQVMAALHEDMGITNDAHPAESLSAGERAAITAPSGGNPEADAHKVGRIAHYCRVLAVPMQRDAAAPTVERGRRLFTDAGCTACHVPTMSTGDASPVALLRNATFHPYTDLLLHDMGEGLADDRRDGDATGREWRTPPLWGIGLVETVNGHTRFLHDGRARNLEQAVLWHGGEAQRSRDRFMAMPAADRKALLAFLESL